MPELPEVETLAQQLKRRVLDKKVIKLEILDSQIVDSNIKKIVPFQIKKIVRRAKSIIFELDRGHFLLIHLRMTGHFHHLPQGKKLSPDFERFVVAKFYLNDGSLLTHNSIRKFGRIRLVDKKELENELSKLGPEPLAEEFTLAKFQENLAGRKKSNLKVLLLDQKFLAGVGNIYAQEVLYHAGIDPRRKVEDLSELETKKLYHQLRRVLMLAVKYHGTTIESYVHIEGLGGFQKYLAVYHQEKCPRGHQNKNQALGGRSTYYCSKCQK